MHFAIGAIDGEDLMIITPVLLCSTASGNGARILQIGGRLHFLGTAYMICSIPGE